MRITNKLGLPQPIVDAVKNDNYTRGPHDISVTTLCGPARVAALQEKYSSVIEEDAADRVWSLMGQLMHLLLERADTTGLSEHRLSMQIDDWSISGQVDRYFDGVLQDYKFVPIMKVQDGVPQEYLEQLNCYAELLRRNGHVVKKIELIAILRDWAKSRTYTERNYPPKNIVVLEVPLWSPDECYRFIQNRVVIHKKARLGDLPECTPQERWAKKTTFAVKEKGAKQAMRGGVFGTLAEAEEFLLALPNPEKAFIEHRPGFSPRCELYCNVNQFCDQYRKIKS